MIRGQGEFGFYLNGAYFVNFEVIDTENYWFLKSGYTVSQSCHLM